MGVYLGDSGKLRVIFENIFSRLNIYSEEPFTNGILLRSSDGHYLKDMNGLYLTAKESE